MVIMMMPLMIVMMIVMMMMMFGMVPTMHKEAVTLTDASRTKSDGSASLLVFSSDKFSIRKTIKSFFLCRYFVKILFLTYSNASCEMNQDLYKERMIEKQYHMHMHMQIMLPYMPT